MGSACRDATDRRHPLVVGASGVIGQAAVEHFSATGVGHGLPEFLLRLMARAAVTRHIPRRGARAQSFGIGSGRMPRRGRSTREDHGCMVASVCGKRVGA